MFRMTLHNDFMSNVQFKKCFVTLNDKIVEYATVSQNLQRRRQDGSEEILVQKEEDKQK